jgi:cell division protein FtsB
MTPQNNPQQQKQHAWPLRRSILVGLFILVSAAYLIFALFSGGSAAEDVSLGTIVSAIEAGQMENLRVQGDALVATKTDGARLSSRKEAGDGLSELQL